MHSKQALAVLALAASTATPVLSAPLPENQEQARAELDARLSLGPILKTIGINAGIGAIPGILGEITGGDNNAARELAAREELEARLSLGPLLKTIGINAGIGAIPALLGDITGGNNNGARELAAELDERGLGSLVGSAVEAIEDNGSIGKVLGHGLIGGVASGVGGVVTQGVLGGNNSRREPEPLNLGGLGKLLGTGLLGGVASGVGAVVSQDILGNNRREPEPLTLGSIGKDLAGIIANLGGSDIASVLGGGNSQRDLTPEETIAALSLINKRSPEPLSIGSIGKDLAGIIANLGGSDIASEVLGGGNSQRDLTPEEIAALSLISKRSPEPINLTGFGKGLAGIIAGLAGSQIASEVLGGGNSQRDLTPEMIAALSLISKREISMEDLKIPFGFGPGPVVLPESTLNQLD